MGDIYGPAAQGLYTYKQFQGRHMAELTKLSDQLKKADPETDGAAINDMRIRIEQIQVAIQYASDVASLILTASKFPQ